ncbi:hypothetical protein E2562_003121 [Oryza meyeriana var. granulata]|uniref:Uncharacterized protein n=1 Tax=Oryza meyeriana var. granulata TaxID=110450 RepID=A0A6G1E963_9ORYZ|nr:hypothetical protein E2562_003121 [Oryza meyeriana var. granulata]
MAKRRGDSSVDPGGNDGQRGAPGRWGPWLQLGSAARLEKHDDNIPWEDRKGAHRLNFIKEFALLELALAK